MKLNVESATDIAIRYIVRAGNAFYKVEQVEQRGDKWVIMFDVGVLTKSLKAVTVDDASGQVVGYG